MNKTPYIFHIGFNKSGSKSLHSALQLLNIPSIHNSSYLTIKYNIDHGKKPFYKLDKKYQAFIDCINFDFNVLDAIISQYPNSKYIVTIRPFDDWIRSRKMSNLYKKTKYVSKTKEEYDDNLSNVHKYFKNRSEQLLVIKICEGQGWKELCNFLNLPIPNFPFPFVNSTIDFKK